MVDGEATKKGQALLSELESELTPDARDTDPEPSRLEDFLGGRSAEQVAPETPAEAAQVVGMRSAQLVSCEGREALVRFRSNPQAVAARVAPEVDLKLLALALRNRDSVLIESDGERLWLVGILQVRLPERIEVRAREVLIEADQELTLRSGRAGARLRKDGDVELVGSRISAASRGLFRIVGRILRLN